MNFATGFTKSTSTILRCIHVQQGVEIHTVVHKAAALLGNVFILLEFLCVLLFH